MTLKIDPDLYKEFLKPSYDIVPTCVAEPVDQELVETIYLKIHYALHKWIGNGLEPRYIKLNKAAYAAYYIRRQIQLNDTKLPDKLIPDYPIILDLDSDVLIKIFGSTRTESLRADEIKKIRGWYEAGD